MYQYILGNLYSSRFQKNFFEKSLVLFIYLSFHNLLCPILRNSHFAFPIGQFLFMTLSEKVQGVGKINKKYKRVEQELTP